MWYFLRQDLFGEATGVELSAPQSADFNWVDGIRFDRAYPLETFVLDDAYGSNYPDFFDTTVPVMSHRLIALLRACGVSNLDDYPVILHAPESGARRTDYSAVNLVGLVDAVDLAASVHEVRRGKPRFTGAISIADERTAGLRAFRLPTSPRFIVIAHDVAVRVAASGFDSVLVQPTLDYRGV